MAVLRAAGRLQLVVNGAAGVAAGVTSADQPLLVRSYMPESGVIVSDGIESDYVALNSGAVATIGVAERKARLIAKG